MSNRIEKATERMASREQVRRTSELIASRSTKLQLADFQIDMMESPHRIQANPPVEYVLVMYQTVHRCGCY